MDPDLRTYVNPTFTKGGRRNVEGSGSEDWADKVKPPPEEIDSGEGVRSRKGPLARRLSRRMRSKGYPPDGVLNG